VTHAQTYLFGRVGPFGLLMAASLVLHVRAADDLTSDSDEATDVIDLRGLFGVDERPRGSCVTLAADGRSDCVIMLDRVGNLHSIDDSEFLALPSAFRYASSAFDAVCGRAIEGINGLRVRVSPIFTPMSDATPGVE
jgi:hypothetical protein